VAALTRYVNTASTAGGDGTTNNTSGATRAFASLAEALNSLPSWPTALSDQYTIYCSGTAADTTTCNQDVMDQVTSTTNYIRIVGDNTTGKWNTSAYRLEISNGHGFYNNYGAHVRVENMQVKVTSTSGGTNYNCYRLATANNDSSGGNIDHRLINCIAWGVQSGGPNIFGFIDSDPGASGACYRINCLAYDAYCGYSSDSSTWATNNLYNYNCTGHSNAINWLDVQKCVNCLSANPTTGAGYGFYVTGSTGHSYNASDDDTANGTGARDNQTFTFVDAANDDYHLAANDAGARGYGTTNPGSGLYSTDIDGQTRAAPWDIGADQVIAPYEQEGYRWRNDNGSETAATWKASQDTAASIATAANFRLRVLLKRTN
jgi:hypothetical protein